jgi:hypothetical protein
MSEPHGAGEACPLSKEFEHDTLKNIKYPFSPNKPIEHRDLVEKTAITAKQVGDVIEWEATHKAFELPPRLPASPLLAQKVLLQSAMDRMNRGFEADQGVLENVDAPIIADLDSPKTWPKASPSAAVSSGPTVWDKIRQLHTPHDKQNPVGTATEGTNETSRGHPSA